MTVRTDTKFDQVPKGTLTKTGQTVGAGQTVNIYSSTRKDIVDVGDCYAFNVNRFYFEGGVINKPNSNYFAASAVNYIADALTLASASSTFGHLPMSNVPDVVTAATQAAARTNPSRPYVDVVQNIFELRETIEWMRDSVKDAVVAYPGTRFHRRRRGGQVSPGNANLALQFGILPIVSDLVKLLSFQDQVDRRVMEIERLFKRGLKRTVDIGTFSTSGKANPYLQTQWILIRPEFDVKTVVSVRAHCRWIPTVSASHLRTPTAMRELARKAVLGLTLDLKTLWEVTPWSWLIDWSTEMGNFLAAQRNIIPAVLQGVYVMQHTRSEWSMPQDVAYPDGTTMSKVHVVNETKSRQQSFVAPVAHLPFLSANQMGIIASLATRRGVSVR